MKKIFLIFIVVIEFLGCDIYIDKQFSDIAEGHTLYYLPEWKDLDTYPKIAKWINNHVNYKTESRYEHNWQNPEYTLQRGYGDCEDIALLFMNIYYVSTGNKMDLILVLLSNKQIVKGGKIDHAMLLYQNAIIETYSAGSVLNELYWGSLKISFTFHL
jgi:hypothetical protein